VLFDKGAIWLDDQLTVQPEGTPLLRQALHPVDKATPFL
jgi:hypothetical protein